MAELRSRSGFWMLVQIKFNENNKKGIPVVKRETYVVEAATFIDAEQRIHDEMNYNNRPITVSAISRPTFGEICFSSDAEAENFYKVKVQTSEEVSVKTRKGGYRTKTKITSHYYLVQAANVEDARTAVKDEIYKSSNEQYEIADIVKTRILDVLEYQKHLQTLAGTDAGK